MVDYSAANLSTLARISRRAGSRGARRRGEGHSRRDFALSDKPVLLGLAVAAAARDPKGIGSFANSGLQVLFHIRPIVRLVVTRHPGSEGTLRALPSIEQN